MTFIITDPSFTKHKTGMGHPEQPLRYAAIEKGLQQAGLLTFATTIKPRLALENEVLLCHTKLYFDLVKKEIEQLASHQLTMLSTGDVVISPDSFQIALLSTGAVLTAVDKVMTSKPGTTCFCNIRPPGHHACSTQGMGFCLFNNVAIGARYAQQKYGVKNILIVDWDVHHGNGTQEIFYDDPTVFYFSTHEKDNYPGTGFAEETGHGTAKGTTLNFPIAAGIDSRLKVFDAFEKLKERMREFKPELIFISAGFDAHEKDPLGHFNLTDSDFANLTNIVKEIANEYCEGKIISVLEGGYNLEALASASIAHVNALKA